MSIVKALSPRDLDGSLIFGCELSKQLDCKRTEALQKYEQVFLHKF